MEKVKSQSQIKRSKLEKQEIQNRNRKSDNQSRNRKINIIEIKTQNLVDELKIVRRKRSKFEKKN